MYLGPTANRPMYFFLLKKIVAPSYIKSKYALNSILYTYIRKPIAYLFIFLKGQSYF